MEIEKKFGIAITATEKATPSSIVKFRDGLLGVVSERLKNNQYRVDIPLEGVTIENDTTVEPKHLHFLSDEEIKSGDFYYNQHDSHDGKIYKMGSSSSILYDGINKRIIASTDVKLIVDSKDDILDIHEDFSLPFVKAHNEGNPITEVKLEFNEKYYYNLDELRARSVNKLPLEYFRAESLKTTDDNCVIIRIEERKTSYIRLLTYENAMDVIDFINDKKGDDYAYITAGGVGVQLSSSMLDTVKNYLDTQELVYEITKDHPTRVEEELIFNLKA